MKTVILSLILSHVGFASGQTILLSEYKIPDWNNGQMTLYFDLAIHPEIMPDGSFQFAETMPEDIEFWMEHDKRWVAEDMFPYCFDDALDQLEISKPNVSFWYFQTARLNARTDGTHDGTVQLQQSSGKALGFMYADRAVAIKGRCQTSADVFVDIVLDLDNDVRYVQIESANASETAFVFTTNVPKEAIANAVWVANLK